MTTRLHGAGLVALALAALVSSAQLRADIAGVSASAEETIYFYRVGGTLRQAVRIDFTSSLPQAAAAQVEITAGGDTVQTDVAIAPGSSSALAYAPVVFPAPPSSAAVAVRVGAERLDLGLILGKERPWTIYVCQDKHLDYSWAYRLPQMIDLMRSLVTFYVQSAAQSAALPDEEQHRFNFDVALWAEEYLSHETPAARSGLLEQMRAGRLACSGFFAVNLTGVLSTEETIRSLYYSRSLERDFGARVAFSMSNEVPTVTWGLASILHHAGLPYAGKGGPLSPNGYHLERAPDRLYRWEGPDGSQVWMKWDDFVGPKELGSYGEAYPLLFGSYSNKLEYILKVLDIYRQDTRYPYDAIALLGSGHDDFPQSDVIHDFLSQFRRSFPTADRPAEFPKLINSTFVMFYDHVERFLAEHPSIAPKVEHGDYGATWEQSVSCMPGLIQRARRARSLLEDAQAIDAFVLRLDPGGHAGRAQAFDRAYRNLLRIPEHVWDGVSNQTSQGVSENKLGWLEQAEANAQSAQASGLLSLGASISTASGRRVAIINTLSFPRSDLAAVATPGPGPFRVRDLASGVEAASQVVDGKIVFIAPAVPAFAYRVFAVEAGGSAGAPRVTAGAASLESPTHRLEVRTGDGALARLIDKRTGRDLASAQGLNLYALNGSGPQSVVVRPAEAGAVLGRIAVDRLSPGAVLTTVYTLYADLERVEIENRLVKDAAAVIQKLEYEFPLNFSSPQIRYETTGAITRFGYAPLGDQIPGADVGQVAAQDFVDLTAAGGTDGVIVCQPDSPIVRFGSSYGNQADTSTGRVLFKVASAYSSASDSPYLTVFPIRYGLVSYRGPHDGFRAVAAGAGFARPLLALELAEGQSGPLDSSGQRLLGIDAGQAVATVLKVSEEGVEDGLILRLWETSGAPAAVDLDLRGLGAGPRAAVTDLLERNLGPLPVSGGTASVVVNPRSFAAVRLLPAREPFLVETGELPAGAVGVPYSELALAASGGESPLAWWRASGAFPRGLQLSADGKISGVPEVAGSYGFRVYARDARGRAAARDLTLRILSEPFSLRTLQVLSPNGGEYLRGNAQVRFRSDGSWPPGSQVEVTVLGPVQTPVRVIAAAAAPEAASLDWTTLGLADASGFRVQVRALDDPAVFDRSDAAFTIDNAPPDAPALLEPADGSRGVSGAPVLLGLPGVDATSGVPLAGGYRFELRRSGSVEPPLQSGWIDEPRWPVQGLVGSSAHHFRLQTRDRAGNESAWSAEWCFTTAIQSRGELPAAADAHLVEAFPDQNTGGSAVLELGRFSGADAGDDTSILLRFDLSGIPAGAVIASATLRLQVLGADGGAPVRRIGARRMRRRWVEGSGTGASGVQPTDGSVTWREARHGAEAWEAAGAEGATDRSPTAEDVKEVGPAPGAALWDLTQAAVAWLQDPSANFGVILVEESPGSADGLLRFASREHADAAARPRLAVSWSGGAPDALFVRGNVNGDATIDITDGIYVLLYLFLGGTVLDCQDAADVNDDGRLDVSDPIWLLAYLFQGNEAPRPPFPDAGADPTPDALSCDGRRG